MQALVVDEPTRQAGQALALAADNRTDIACRPCPYFSGRNASDLYPGADAVLRGCPNLNSLPLSAVRPPLPVTKDFERKRHPCQECFERPPGNIMEMVASQPRYAAELKAASAHCKHGVLLGDSHAEHYWPAFDVISKRMGFYFTLLNRAACPRTVALTRRGISPQGSPDKGCQQFVGNAVSWILHARPSLVTRDGLGLRFPQPLRSHRRRHKQHRSGSWRGRPSQATYLGRHPCPGNEGDADHEG